MVQSLAASSYVLGQDAVLRVRVAAEAPPAAATLFLRPLGRGWYDRLPLLPAGGYDFSATIPARMLGEGPHEFSVSLAAGAVTTTFPGALPGSPADWNWEAPGSWTFEAVSPGMPLRLLDPAADAERLAWTRLGDGGRRGVFRVSLSAVTGRPVLRFSLPGPEGGMAHGDYTGSLVVAGRVRDRAPWVDGKEAVRLRLRGLGARQVLHLTLMEDDGTSWTAPVTVDSSWHEVVIPASAFRAGRGVLLPQGFPGQWNYWVGPAAGRGGAGDQLRAGRLERLQLSLRAEDAADAKPEEYGVEVEWVVLEPGDPR